ncbi:MAG TPA: PadR family transcriptional regulator [Micromonosporaceae bacterium]|jgi:DNA-binding PadR family transcriptional regulator|nr:PadR family transcriptional regulator [Micromonosporaceae bacterium]
MTAVFSHGRLRLYLLKLLAEGPKHGYELIRLLENRFLGLYAPSAGTIYPRLARMETEGLVTHTAAGGRKVYEITEAGRAELRGRAAELAELETEIRASVEDLAGLATEIQHEVRGSVRDMKRELREAARATSAGRYVPPRRQAVARRPVRPPRGWERTAESPAVELDRRLAEFSTELRELVGSVRIDDSTVRAIGRTLDATLAQLHRLLR